MRSFDLINKLWEVLSQDPEMIELLGLYDDTDYRKKLRTENVQAEEYDVNNIPFVTMYFLEAENTWNYLVNQGFLCMEIYADSMETAAPIYKRIVNLVHSEFDIRVFWEGQMQSGIHPVYKYRVAFRSLIST